MYTTEIKYCSVRNNVILNNNNIMTYVENSNYPITNKTMFSLNKRWFINNIIYLILHPIETNANNLIIMKIDNIFYN